MFGLHHHMAAALRARQGVLNQGPVSQTPLPVPQMAPRPTYVPTAYQHTQALPAAAAPAAYAQQPAVQMSPVEQGMTVAALRSRMNTAPQYPTPAPQ